MEEINKQIEDVKAVARKQLKDLAKKKDLANKNNLYATDEEFKEKLKKRSREYYRNKIRPNKVFKYKASELKILEDKE
jgi:hypothetical protein